MVVVRVAGGDVLRGTENTLSFAVSSMVRTKMKETAEYSFGERSKGCGADCARVLQWPASSFPNC